MQYLLLIYETPGAYANFTEAEMGALLAEYNEFGEAGGEKVLGGNALQPVTEACSVRVRNGKATTTDGPFAETKEHLGGYYLVEADDLDDAIRLAAKIPGARLGTVEVRPIMTFD